MNAQQMQQNMSLVLRFNDEVYNKHYVDRLDQFFNADVVIHDPALGDQPANFRQYHDMEAGYTHAFPDKNFHIDDMFASEDKVVIRWTGVGTHRGELQGVRPSNNRIHITGMCIYRFADGKISEVWQSWDRLSLLEQIGAVQTAHVLHG
jgi:steroid delta-isomerase-like uncharacterized protein